ncbi:MAG: hypothetical protein KDB14_35150 [Planctomycetales bacterium]|nr:hypothetical protein [Planctomycetales bacterium]
MSDQEENRGIDEDEGEQGSMAPDLKEISEIESILICDHITVSDGGMPLYPNANYRRYLAMCDSMVIQSTYRSSDADSARSVLRSSLLGRWSYLMRFRLARMTQSTFGDDAPSSFSQQISGALTSPVKVRPCGGVWVAESSAGQEARRFGLTEWDAAISLRSWLMSQLRDHMIGSAFGVMDAASVGAPNRDQASADPSPSILREAEEIVSVGRQEQHGTPEDCFGLIAEFWSLWLDRRVSSQDVAMMMVLLKAARARHRCRDGEDIQRDTLVDLAGYAACCDRMRRK